jgi:hypothetical protein
MICAVLQLLIEWVEHGTYLQSQLLVSRTLWILRAMPLQHSNDFQHALNVFATPLAINDKRKLKSRGWHDSHDLLVAGEYGDWRLEPKTSDFAMSCPTALQHITLTIVVAVEQ